MLPPSRDMLPPFRRMLPPCREGLPELRDLLPESRESFPGANLNLNLLSCGFSGPVRHCLDEGVQPRQNSGISPQFAMSLAGVVAALNLVAVKLLKIENSAPDAIDQFLAGEVANSDLDVSLVEPSIVLIGVHKAIWGVLHGS